jgi:hypothetical protein
VSGFGFQGVAVLYPETSYETTVKSEPQNIEYRMSNVEGWNRCAQSFLEWTEFIYSTFDVGRSMFDVHQFLFRFDWPFFWPEAALV